MDDQARYLDAMRRFSGDAHMVAQVFDSMSQRGFTPAAEHWQLLLDAHLSAGDIDTAEATVAKMVATGVTISDTQLFDLGVTFFRRGEVSRAITQFDRLHQRGARPGPRHAPAVFNAFLQAQRFPAARAVLRDMAQRGETVPQASYTQLLRDALKRRAVKDTEALIATMLASSVTPDQRIASELAIMVCQAADPGRALALVTQLLDANVSFTPAVYAAVLRGHVLQQDHEGVIACVAAFGRYGVPLSSYALNALVGARLATGDSQGAFEALSQLWDSAMTATGENLTATITQSLAAGSPARAQACLTAMLFTATPVTADEMHSVISAQLAAGKVDDAIAIVRDALAGNVTFDRRVLRDITKALLAKGALRETLLLLADARHAGVVSARSYGEVLTFVLRQKRHDRAVRLIDHFGKERIRLNATDASYIIRALGKDASREQALYAARAFAAQKVYGDEPTYRELLWECARAGDTKATRTVYDMLTAAGHPHEESHDKALAWATGQTARRLDGPVEVPQTPVKPADFEVPSEDKAAAAETAPATNPASDSTDEQLLPPLAPFSPEKPSST